MNEKLGHLSQIAYIRRYMLLDGREDGIKVVEINNGQPQIDVERK